MNFDFLKDLRGLGYVYENCCNAEKLAVAMPVQSVFTSRKSAELLAKFLYMAAHNQEMENLSFADILSDITVRRFVNSRDVMDAFHFIRKSGNRAVHGSEEESVDDAIAVLQDLHYIAGETACILGLIDDYPLFEDRIATYPESKYANEEDINKKAREMFLDYVEEFNAQQERDQYLLMQDYDYLAHSIEGNVEMHEFLEFKYAPKQSVLIEYLQTYLATLLRLSIERSPERARELELAHPVILDAKLIIDGATYTSADIESFVVALMEKLPKAKSIIIDCMCNGVLREFFHDVLDENENINMIRKNSTWTGAGMLDTLQAYKRRNLFTYKLAIFYPDSGESKYEKILNGREINVIASGTPDIIERKFEEEWWSWNLSLWVDFDYEKHYDVLTKLRDLVRKRIPKAELLYCEESWEEEDSCMLCNGIQWNCESLKEVQTFLDELNKELLPIKDEVDAGGEGTWEVRKDFAVATWDWTEHGFKVIGLCY